MHCLGQRSLCQQRRRHSLSWGNGCFVFKIKTHRRTKNKVCPISAFASPSQILLPPGSQPRGSVLWVCTAGSAQPPVPQPHPQRGSAAGLGGRKGLHTHRWHQERAAQARTHSLPPGHPRRGQGPRSTLAPRRPRPPALFFTLSLPIILARQAAFSCSARGDIAVQGRGGSRGTEISTVLHAAKAPQQPGSLPRLPINPHMEVASVYLHKHGSWDGASLEDRSFPSYLHPSQPLVQHK